MTQAAPGVDTASKKGQRPTGRGRPSREQSAAITEAIIYVAAEMFLTDGFDGTSMEAIAATVHIPKTTLYKRYPDKMALLNAVLADRVASWSRITTPQTEKLGTDFRTRLVHHTATMFEWTTKPEVRAYTRLMLSAAGRGPSDISAEFFGYTEMVSVLTKEIVAYGPAAGIRAKDPGQIAQVIMAMISGWLGVRGITKPLTHEQALAEAEYIVDVLMRGSEAW